MVALDEMGSFSRAAEAIGLSQPALSRSIAQLEADCGIRLFDRSSGIVTPTPAGAQLVVKAREMIEQAGRLEQDIRALRGGTGGSIAFGLGPMLAGLVLPTLVAGLTKEHPRILIRPMVASAEELMEALLAGQIEFFLMTERPSGKGIAVAVRRVGQVRLAFMVRRDHPLAGRSAVDYEALEAYPVASGSSVYWIDASSERFITTEPTIICDNFEILRDIMLTSNTVWLGSPDLIAAADQPRIAILDFTNPKEWTRPVVLVRRPDRTASPLSRRVEAMITEIFLKNPIAGQASFQPLS